MIDAACDEPVAEVDALVAAIGPRLTSPTGQRRDAVLVTGPWLAGVSAVVAALGELLPEHTFVESADLAAGDVPTAVVFVVSAAAVMTGSDCALLDAAAADTDAVIGVVSKTDVHRNWRELMAVNQDIVATYASRYREMRWVGVAAAPERGDRHLADLVGAVREQLADGAVERRNRLRSWEFRIQSLADRYSRDVEGAGRQARVAALREQRSTAVSQRRLAKSERTIALRSQIQQARVQLSYFARNRCASVRGELQEDAGSLTRRTLPEYEPYARGRINEVVTEVARGCTQHLADVAQVLGLTGQPSPASAPLPQPDIPGSPLRPRRLETRLMMLLGAGFGLGVALTLSRLLVDLAPGLTAAGVVACMAIGLAVTVWVVGTRGLLHDRAVLDRWIGEAIAAVRAAAEQLVATRVLAAESAFSAALGEQDETANAEVAARVGEIDTELREHAVAARHAAALRDREMPTLQRALDAIRAELGEAVAEGDAHRPLAAETTAPVGGENGKRI